MCTYFKTKTDVAQTLIHKIFLTLTVRKPSIGKILIEKKYGSMELISEKMEALYVELNKRAEAATSSYSALGNFSQYIYSVLVGKTQKKIQSKCLVHEFFFTDVF